MILKYRDIVTSIPKIPTDVLRELIAYMKLELVIREANGESDEKK